MTLTLSLLGRPVLSVSLWRDAAPLEDEELVELESDEDDWRPWHER